MGLLKPNKDKVKAKSKIKTSNFFKITLVLFVAVVVIIGVNYISSRALRETVDIVKLKSAVAQDGMITTDNLIKDTLLRIEYEKQGIMKLSDGSKKRAIVLWDDRNKIINNYAAYYIRQNTPIYWDSISKEIPKRYSYLYKMDGELLKLELSANQFGNMLVPGDRINVRTSFNEQVYTLPSEQEFFMQQQMGIQNQTVARRQIMLFNSALVLDILNNKGESIFDLYYELLSLPKARQREIINTKEFQDQVKPVQILLNVTPEEADRYMSIQGKSPTYMMTLLPRTSSNLITEALNELQTGFARQNIN